MSIVLLILKIIGIVLLAILGLLLFLICLILFVPIRYKLEGSKELEDSKFLVSGKVTYLLHILNVYVKYYEKLEYALRVFVFKIISSDKKEKKDRQEKKSRKVKKIDEETAKPVSEQDESEADFTNTEGLDFTFDRNEEENIEEQEDQESHQTENVQASENQNEDSKDKTSIFEKVASFIEKVFDFIFNMPDKIEAIENKVDDVKNNAEYYIEALSDEKNKEAIALCLQSLLKILKSIRPRRIKGYIHIGKEDPYVMGKILSIYSMIYPLTHDKIKFESEFDEELLEGNIYIKGKVTVIVLVIAAVRIYFNKNVRNLIKVLKREEGK